MPIEMEISIWEKLRISFTGWKRISYTDMMMKMNKILEALLLAMEDLVLSIGRHHTKLGLKEQVIVKIWLFYK